jgi:hypothetical protein
MSYTELEARQIKEVIHIIKAKHRKLSIRHIDTISKDVLDTMYHDEQVSSVHDKKKITMGVLKKIFVKDSHKFISPSSSPYLMGQSPRHPDNLRLIQDCEPEIDRVISEHTSKKIRERDSSCRHCWCTIL